MGVVWKSELRRWMMVWWQTRWQTRRQTATETAVGAGSMKELFAEAWAGLRDNSANKGAQQV